MIKKNMRRKVFYVVPDISQVSGGPRTRITMFRQVFESNHDTVIMGRNKFLKSIRAHKTDLLYIESATNRISITDFFSLIYLRLLSKDVIVFIRDIYIELFPEEYATFRGKITLTLNKWSNWFLTLISTNMVFPTEAMGRLFFDRNKRYPRRGYFALPPGCKPLNTPRVLPDFSKITGILYLGSVSYTNAGFEHFLHFADQYKDRYKFFVLSGDSNAPQLIGNREHVLLEKIEHEEIPAFIKNHNISLALHTRPRNDYDDLTFPIKVLDFVSFQLPFISEDHLPLQELLGKDYWLFAKFSDYKTIERRIQDLSNKEKYSEMITFLTGIAGQNTYEVRYHRLEYKGKK